MQLKDPGFFFMKHIKIEKISYKICVTTYIQCSSFSLKEEEYQQEGLGGMEKIKWTQVKNSVNGLHHGEEQKIYETGVIEVW